MPGVFAGGMLQVPIGTAIVPKLQPPGKVDHARDL
jgi:hypothetical protein